MADPSGDPLGLGAPPTSSANAPTYLGLPDGAVVTIIEGADFGRGRGGPGGGQQNMGRGANGLANNERIAPWGSGGGYTANDVAAVLASMPAERLARLQREMAGSGLIGSQTKFTLGAPDNTTRSAFAELLGMANLRGVPWQTQMDSLMRFGADANREAAQLTARQRVEAQFSTRLNTYERSDPATVRQAAEGAFRDVLGRKPKAEELTGFVARYQSRERASQASVFAAQDAVTGQDRKRAVAFADLEDTAALPSDGSESDVLWERLQRMIADAPGSITAGSRSRDYATQVKLWNAYKAGRGPMAAKPGTSKHGDGRANDLKYESDAVRQWALANAGRYGLAFPIYNPKLSRSRDESWHVEVAKGSVAGGQPAGGDSHRGAVALSRDVTAQRQDLGAQAVEYARNANPTETAAYDVGATFQNFLAILNRGVA